MRKGCMAILLGLLFVGCQRDETTSGPKAHISIINMALGSDPVNLLLNDQPLTGTDVAFGNASDSLGDSYIETSPGVRNSSWLVGGEAVALDKFVSWNAGSYYTMVHYDTAVNKVAQLLIVTDAPLQNDSVGKVRFINCYAAGDSISLWMHYIGNSDTTILRLVNKQPFLDRNKSVNSSFSYSLRPGSWELIMKDRFYETLFMDTVSIANNALYSVVAVGEPGGTGDRAPQMKLVLQMK